MQKSSNPGRLWAAGILAGILVLAGCADVVTEPQARGGNREGRVTITIDAGARTVLPSEVRFSRFEIRIVEQGGSQEREPVEATTGGTGGAKYWRR
jgi:hypothetical protein